MRGTVLQYDDNAGTGLISGDDGNRYTFRRAELQQLRPITAGNKVDFIPSEGTATEIYLMDHASAPAASAPEPASGGFGGAFAAAAPSGATAYSGEDLGLWDYFRKVMAKSFNGEGRARRKEYWSFVLFYCLIWMALYVGLMFTVMDALVELYDTYGSGYFESNPMALVEALGGWFYVILILGFVFLPATVTVLIRRLHDIGLSGWWILGAIVPFFGPLALFVCTLIPSQGHPNQHGPIPKAMPGAYRG